MDSSMVTIGFITYGKSTSKYLPYFLESLAKSTYRDAQIYAIDNSEEENNENLEFIRENFLNIEVERPGMNIGFARANNLMIRKAINDGSKYFLALNPDMIIEPDMIARLVTAMESDKKIAAVQPKILKWDFEHKKKTDKIDSLGLKMDNKHRFNDLNQGDNNKDEKHVSEVFGFTGAAVLLRLDAMEDISFDGQFFDELMFMYKEDCDLSYRLRLAGWNILICPEAVCYHDRTAAKAGENIWETAANRRRKPKMIRQWSFLNQMILMSKFSGLSFSVKTRINSLIYKAQMIAYVFIFEPDVIGQVFEFLRIRKYVSRWRRNLKVRIRIEELEKWMS